MHCVGVSCDANRLYALLASQLTIWTPESGHCLVCKSKRLLPNLNCMVDALYKTLPRSTCSLSFFPVLVVPKIERSVPPGCNPIGKSSPPSIRLAQTLKEWRLSIKRSRPSTTRALRRRLSYWGNSLRKQLVWRNSKQKSVSRTASDCVGVRLSESETEWEWDWVRVRPVVPSQCFLWNLCSCNVLL